MATTNAQGWRVKVTGLPANLSVADLAQRLSVPTHQVGIPKIQNDPSNWYAWINGFETEQQADHFVVSWNEATLFGGNKIRCKASQNSARITADQSSTAPKSSSSRSRLPNSSSHRSYNDQTNSRQENERHDQGMILSKMSSLTTDAVRSWDDHHSAKCGNFSPTFNTKHQVTQSSLTDSQLPRLPGQARDSSSSSQSSTQSRNYLNEHRSSNHPPGWEVCKNGVQCDDFDCTAMHPVGRRTKCSLGSACQNSQCYALHPPSRPKVCYYGKRCHNTACLRLHPADRQLCVSGVECLELECTRTHPPGRPIKCADGIRCDNFNCSRLHPREWDPTEDTTLGGSQPQASRVQQNQYNLKSLKIRMAEREKLPLPILASRTEFCQRLESEKMLVVTAETGSGKSTQLPQYAAEHFSDGLIICTQPRVVAAVSLARRVAGEYDGTSEGKSVGYQVGSGSGKNTRVQGTNIMFMTDAALIHENQSDPNLSRVRVLIIDEAHERSLNTDIVIGIAKLLLERRPNDFFVVIASATIDPARFLRFFDRESNRALSVPGRVFLVNEHYLPPPEGCTDQKLIEVHVVPTILRLLPKHQGHTLVFLHGQREIEQALKLFNRDIPDGCVALPLYGSLSPEEQQKVLEFDDEDSKRRMVVFCTNVAETSLTIKNTRLVIDIGLAKEARFDMRRRLTVIETVRISNSSANQRKGRAGRTVAGDCFRLYKKSDLKRENIEPEILRSSLDLVILQLVRLGLNPRTFPFMDAPDTDVLKNSLELLTRLSCIRNETTSTIRGQLFAELSLDPRLSAFMVNMYTDVGGERLLSLTATIVAILSAPGLIFYMGGASKEAKDEARSRVAVGAHEHDSDLLYLCAVYNKWKNAGMIDRTTNTCMSCQKSNSKRFDACRSCRTQHSKSNGLNNKIVQTIDSSSELYVKTIMNPRWKLIACKNTVIDSNERDVIGEHLYKLFPEQLGHLLVSHLPDEGVRLISSELRARITNTSVVVQRLHDHGYQHFITMSITQLPTGDYIVDRLHPVPSRSLPPVPVQNLDHIDNVGWVLNNEIRKTLDQYRSESWAKWLVYEYDRRACRVTVWGMQSEKETIQSILLSSFKDSWLKLSSETQSIECGPILASFKNGLICSTIDTMDNTLRLDLQHVPCANLDRLQTWLQTTLDISRHDIKENNFRVRTGRGEHDDEDDGYEAPPFYIVFKSAQTFQKATARVPCHYVCPPGAVLSSSTTGTRMGEKDAWGRQLIITTTRETGLRTSDQIAERLAPHVVDCRERGIRSRPPQPAIQLLNLPVDADETFVRQALGTVNPARINLRQGNKDGTGSSSAHIFFNDEQQRQQAFMVLHEDLCQRSLVINIRSKKTQQLVQKAVIPTASALLPKESSAQTFLVTAVNRETAFKLYAEIIPHLEPSWSIDSSATVTILQTNLYPNFDELVQSISTKFETQVQQQPFEQKRSTDDNNSDKRFVFSHSSPPKTALAAAMLAQATSPIVIKLTSDRQKCLFNELFDLNLIQTWCRRLNLKVDQKNKWGTVLEIRGPQIQQGQLMYQIAEYSDKFEARFRVHDLSTTVGNFFGRQKAANSKLDVIAQKWSNKGCNVTYMKKTNSILIYAQPQTTEVDIQTCETEVQQMLSELAVSDNASQDKRQCVFCQQMSTATKTLRLCGHAYCRCASGILSQTFPLQCHKSTCKANIDIQDLREIFSGREELMRVCKTSLQTYLTARTSTDNRLFCPNDECDGLIKRSTGYQTCLICGRGVCVLCRIIDDDLHEGRTCVEREKIQREMGEFLPRLFKAAEKYARDNWTPELPHIIRIDHNLSLVDTCSSLQRFYKAVEILGDRPPPDMARGFFAFHGTATDAIKAICRNGFDPSRRSGQAYGTGEYFGVTAAISDGYSHEASAGGVKNMLVAFLLRCNQMHTVPGFCHVVNNPTDWLYAYNLPVLVISYGHHASAPSIFGTYQVTAGQEKNDHWRAPFRWHWQDDDQLFRPYTDAINSVLENHFEQFRFYNGKSTVITKPLIRYVDDSPQTYEIDYVNYIQRHTSTMTPRKIERKSVPASKTRNWFFETEHGVWTPYQSLIQDRIEQGYQSYVTMTGPSTIDIQFPGRPEEYQVSFCTGTQMNKATTVIKNIKRQ